MTALPGALILDFGGVLTTDFWACLRAFEHREGLAPGALVDLVTLDPAGHRLICDLERGAIGQAVFEREVGDRLGVDPDGLLARMAADLRPDKEMLDVAAELRAGGVRVAILSNSWGSDYFDPYAPWQLDDLADVVVISDRVGLRKPDPRIFALTVDRLGVPAAACVFVDDIAAYLTPAAALGMTVVHHTGADRTVPALRAAFTP
ncbi:HAD family phosphatase [Longispora sp. K20-0274]|uniref:HAD family hydrolase n=1 Tax=Longispora sp. K20-0274 TaxID=3088255 RepID=UPI003999CEA4